MRDTEGRTPLHLCVGDSAKDVAQAILKCVAESASCVVFVRLACLGQHVGAQTHPLSLTHTQTHARSLTITHSHTHTRTHTRHLLLPSRRSPKTDATIVDDTGRTPLHWAVALANDTMIGLFSKHKSSFDVQDEQGATPLHYLAQLNNDKVTKALLKGIPKGKVDVTDRELRTALFWTIAQDNLNTAELLLKAGANPNHKDTTGRTSQLQLSVRACCACVCVCVCVCMCVCVCVCVCVCACVCACVRACVRAFFFGLHSALPLSIYLFNVRCDGHSTLEQPHRRLAPLSMPQSSTSLL